jgi:trk system potassium uptake protein TrkA
MKILIVGCGKVGYTLASQLCGESHDVTVLDINADSMTDITNGYDVMGVVGDGTSISVLQEADVSEMDLLCAVTDSDEKNLLCCLIARRISKCKTIARVRNPIYSREVQFFKADFDLAMVINPEMAAASEIAHIFRFPSAININTFSKGRVDLLRFRLKKGSLLCGMSLADIHTRLHCDVLVCIVKRGDSVTIPSGDFVVEAGDILSIVASPRNASDFFQKIGIMTNPVRDVLIVGGGKITYYLANLLHNSGINVKIIEHHRDRCEKLSDELPFAEIIFGDGTDENLLREEGIEQVEGFAALTEIDEENILLSLYAQSQTKDKMKIVTKINRITFDEVISSLNLDSVVNPKTITAEYILQFVRSMRAPSSGSSVENLYRLEDAGAEAMEFYLKKESAVTGKPLTELNMKENILICKIYRNGSLITPTGQTTLEMGDSVVLVAMTKEKLDDIDDILKS